MIQGASFFRTVSYYRSWLTCPLTFPLPFDAARAVPGATEVTGPPPCKLSDPEVSATEPLFYPPERAVSKALLERLE
jgi:hypothetical protein